MIWARMLAYITGASIKRSRARLKPETRRVTFEEFSRTHDFFDYRFALSRDADSRLR
jgi:hypothetical protein